MRETKSLLEQKLDRRLLLAGGLAAGGTAVMATAARGQTDHAGHGTPGAAEPQPAHLSA
ncbi:MAG: copper oxidase, partial [Mesorhizobium sp.]